MSDGDVATHIKEIDKDRARLKRMLRAKDAKVLNKRGPGGDWSIVENVRHLLWAEQRHLGVFLPDKVVWNPVGITAFRGREFADVGTKPTKDIEVVFAEWDKVHKETRNAISLLGGSDVAKALSGNHSHLQYHIAHVERLLLKWEK